MRMRLLTFGVAIAGLMVFLPAANGQAVTLQEQLRAQYKTVKMGTDSGGIAIVDPGTLLTIQKGGVLGVPWNSITCAAKFQDNSLKPAGAFCSGMVKANSRLFQPGEKVYPVKIEVSLDKAKISFLVVACDSCNGTNPPTNMKGEVVFQYAKGYLEKAQASAVEDAIGQVFAIANDDQGGGNGGGNDQGNNQGGQDQGGQDQQQETQNVELGMTVDQVVNALGKPLKTVNLGAKQIFVYKDLKVTFKDGKVADVQ